MINSVKPWVPLNNLDIKVSGDANVRVNNDGETDDSLAQVLVAPSLEKQANLTAFCAIGNLNYSHSPGEPSKEGEKRVELANLIYQRNIAQPGSRDKGSVCEEYIKPILASPNKQFFVLETGPATNIYELAIRAIRNKQSLENVTICFYGSVNISWWAKEKSKSFKEFYDAVKESGLTLIQGDGFPTLGKKNQISSTTTPGTKYIWDNCDGEAAIHMKQVHERGANAVRSKQVLSVCNYIADGLAKASEKDKAQLQSLVNDLVGLYKGQIDLTQSDGLVVRLHAIMHQTLPPQEYSQLKTKLADISKLLLTVLNENEKDLNRPFNIYSATALAAQPLLADQIPAILFSEIMEGRRGLLRDAHPVEFAGMDGDFAQFTFCKESKLYYLNTEKKAEKTGEKVDDLHASYLKYIDVCLETALLRNPSMVTEGKKREILNSDYSQGLQKRMKEVQDLGYDLPRSAL